MRLPTFETGLGLSKHQGYRSLRLTNAPGVSISTHRVLPSTFPVDVLSISRLYAILPGLSTWPTSASTKDRSNRQTLEMHLARFTLKLNRLKSWATPVGIRVTTPATTLVALPA